MIRDLTELATLAAMGGTLLLAGCDGDATDTDVTGTDVTDTDAGCPTAGCPASGCPASGCPSSGCPTGTSGFDADYVSSPDFFTQMAGPLPASGTSPHPTSWIYYSEDLRAGIEGTAPFTAPVGATSIKEYYADGATGDVTAYAVMTKQAAGFDDANNNWFYELRDAAGAVTQSGTQANCVSCHSAGTDTDYLLGTEL